MAVSHYPKDVELGNVCGVGMNGYELEQNPQLSSFVAKDLNVEPKLPHEDDSFDGEQGRTAPALACFYNKQHFLHIQAVL